MDGYLLTSPYTNTERIAHTGYQDLEGAVELTGGGSCLGFNLLPEVDYTFKDMVMDEGERSEGANTLPSVSEMIKALGLTGETLLKGIENAQTETVDRLRGWLDQSLNHIDLNLTHHAFIPLGGGVFTFDTPRFSAAGDLLFDVTYKTA
jgi:hypothetical protein